MYPHERILESRRVQWPEHWTNGGTGITKTSGSDTEEIAATVAAFGDKRIYMKGTELHCSMERVNLSDFWAYHRARLAAVEAGDDATDRVQRLVSNL
jgi:hypothetical protein